MSPIRGALVLVLIAAIVGVIWLAGGGDEKPGTVDVADTPSAAPAETARPDAPGAEAAVQRAPETRTEAVPEELLDPEAAEEAAAAKPKYRVSGRVVDEAGSPVRGAAVTLTRDFGREVMFRGKLPSDRECETSADGRFAFEQVPADTGPQLESTYRIRVRPETLSDVSKRLPERLTGDLDVGTLVAPLGGSIAGHVVDDAGNPIRGAEVRVWTREQAKGSTPGILMLGDIGGAKARKVETDASGFFRVDGLEPGEVTALAIADGYTNESVKGIEVQRGVLTSDVTISVSAGGAIEGVVVDAGGRPVEGARVAVLETVIDLSEGSFTGAMDQDLATETDAAGYFRLKGLKKASYHVSASRKGYLAGRLRNVEPGTPDLRLTLEQSGMLYGYVREKGDQRPVTDFEVSVRRDGNFHYDGGPLPVWGRKATVKRGQEAADLTGLAADPGLFAVTDLPGTDVALEVKAEGYTGYRFGPVHVDGGGKARVDVLLTPEIEVSGIAYDAHGEPLPNARIRLEEVDRSGMDGGRGGVRFARRVEVRDDGSGPSVSLGSEGYAATSDTDGFFRIRGVAAGEYRLVASHDEWAPSEPLSLTLVEGQRAGDVEVALRSGGALTGTTYDADGQILPGARVILEKARPAGQGGMNIAGLGLRDSDLFGGGDDLSATSDEAGTYTIRGILPGRYFAELHAPGRGRLEGNMMFVMGGEDGAQKGTPVTIEEGETATADLHLPATGSVAGQVTEAGNPLAGVTVALNQRDEMMPFGGPNARTDDHGRFLLENIAPGKYSLVVSPKHAARPIERDVEVRPRQRVEETVNLPTGVVTGRVTHVDSGAGIAGVTVEVEPAGDGERAEPTTARHSMMFALSIAGDSGGGIRTMSFGNEQEVVSTDENGYFEVRYLEPGDYRVEISGSGIEKMNRDRVRVFEGSRTDGVDFEAVMGAVLIVRPEHSGDDPLLFFRVTVKNKATGEEQTRMEAGQPFLRIDGLAPGRYTVGVSADQKSGELEVQVGSGEEKEVRIPIR